MPHSQTPSNEEEDRGGRPTRRTCTVPEAAQMLGISRNVAYEAAISGELPVIQIGKRKLVPLAALERMLGETGG